VLQQFQSTQHVRYNENNQVHPFSIDDVPSITYDSGAYGHYFNGADRQAAGLPILRPSSKQVAVANGQLSMAKHESRLSLTVFSPMPRKRTCSTISHKSLMSAGKVSDNGTISIFTRDGVTVHREEDVLVTCKGAPLLIGVRDEHGRYRVPSSETRVNGNHEPLPRKLEQNWNRPTVFMISLQPNKPSNGCMQFAVSLLNPHG
jgi:hypothetical protein